MARKVPFSGALYQLHSKKQIPCGAYVEVNGLHDRYGRVLQSTEVDGENGKPQFLNLIRGILPRAAEKPVARF